MSHYQKSFFSTLISGMMIGAGLTLLAVTLSPLSTTTRATVQSNLASALPVPTKAALGCVRRMPGFVPLAQLLHQPWAKSSVLMEPSVNFPDEQLAETISLNEPQTYFFGKKAKAGSLPPFALDIAYVTIYKDDAEAASAAKTWSGLRRRYRDGRVLIAVELNNDWPAFISNAAFLADHQALTAFERQLISCFSGQ